MEAESHGSTLSSKVKAEIPTSRCQGRQRPCSIDGLLAGLLGGTGLKTGISENYL